MKKFFSIVFSRALIVSIFMLLQVAIIIIGLVYFRKYFSYFYLVCFLISILVAIHIVNSKNNPAYKIAWIIPIVLVPIFGALFYLVFGNGKLSKKEKGRAKEVLTRYYSAIEAIGDDSEKLAKENPDACLYANYIKKASGARPNANTSSEYLPLGEVYFEKMMEELKKAKKFIYIEYFIIAPGKMWSEILEILIQKVKEGVDVRVIYDDFGSMFTLPLKYTKTLEKCGIKACVFNRFSPVLSSRFNNRDHRKLAIIDGNVGFTGGINLADEYINEIERFGHWKDCGIMIKGKGVWSMTIMFLALWDFIYGSETQFVNCMPDEEFLKDVKNDGYIQTFTDTPIDNEACGENVYLNIISRAKKYVYINTPYLILDNETITALTLAAKSGVEIKIVTPHIPDKNYVHAVTRAYYDVLVDCGIKIYEYTPGFIHSKTFVSDDYYGVVGSINLDFRSLYLQYECAVAMYGTRSVLKLKEDFLATVENSCEEMTPQRCHNVNIFTRALRSILRLFAPLM